MKKPVAWTRTWAARALIALVTGSVGAQAPTAGRSTAEYFTASVLRGIPLALQRNGYPPGIAARAMRCLESAAPERITPVFVDFLAREFGAEELLVVDAFFASAAGSKVKRIAELVYLRKYGESAEELPTFTADEQAEYDAFLRSPAGRKFSSPAVQDASRPGTEIDQKVGVVIRECQAKVISGR